MKKSLIVLMSMAVFATASFAADAPKAPEAKKAEQNCVTKDKKGNCPAAPKSPKPTPKKKPVPKDAK